MITNSLLTPLMTIFFLKDVIFIFVIVFDLNVILALYSLFLTYLSHSKVLENSRNKSQSHAFLTQKLYIKQKFFPYIFKF